MRTPAHKTQKRSLRDRIVNAGRWTLLQALGMHVMRLASNLIMTRLLVPEAFGLMAVVVVLIGGFTLFTDVGINRSIMREDDGGGAAFLRVAWVMKIGRGAIIALGTCLCGIAFWLLAPSYAPTGSAYADPDLPGLIMLSALVPLIAGFSSTQKNLAERNLQVHYVTLVDLSAQVIQILAMLAFAMVSPTVWALMAGMLVGAIVKSGSTFIFFPGPRMGFAWDREIAGRIWHYGKWLLGSSVFSFVAVNADRFMLAGLLNAAVFGIYVIAQIWVTAGSMVISKISEQVGFPAISEMIRTRPDDVPRLYRKFQSVIDGFCIAAFLTLFLGGQLLIDLLYTPTYAPAGTYLAMLSVSFLALRFNTLNGLIMNLGKSKQMMIISAIRAGSICLLLPLAFTYLGLSGALLVIAINPLVTAPYTLHVLRPFLGRNQVRFDMLWLILTLVVAGYVYATA